MSESKILRAVRNLSGGPIRLWRNHVGTGLQIRHKDPAVTQALVNQCIAVVERHGGYAQRVTFGLPKGSGDLIGMRQVGDTAQFLSVEVKTQTGRVRPEQEKWRAFVNGYGGCALIVRSEDEAREMLGVDKG